MIPAEPTARDATPRATFPKLALLDDEGRGVLRICSEKVANNPGSKHWIATVKDDSRAINAAIKIIHRSNTYDDLVAALGQLVEELKPEHGGEINERHCSICAAVNVARALLARERATKGTTP